MNHIVVKHAAPEVQEFYTPSPSNVLDEVN